jgi:uncharacterized membrane-anchored protein
MKRLFVLLAVILQLALPAWMALERELVVQQGQRIWLRTAPVDPRDIFRGDYVHLDYEISTLAANQISAAVAARGVRRGDILFVRLETAPGGLSRIAGADRERPDQGRFLRGRVVADWRARTAYGPLRLTYGIEKYFVEQGRGQRMEERRGRRGQVQIPLEMEVAVGGDGTAVLVGHRWSPLGIGLKVLNPPPETPPPERGAPRAPLMELTLRNASDTPLSLPLRPGLCSFRLQAVKDAPRHIRRHPPGCADTRPRQEMLAPGEERSFRFDFNQPGWQVDLDGTPTPLAQLDWRQRFRLVYEAPETPDRPAPGAMALWYGELATQAFHGRGRID